MALSLCVLIAAMTFALGFHWIVGAPFGRPNIIKETQRSTCHHRAIETIAKELKNPLDASTCRKILRCRECDEWWIDGERTTEGDVRLELANGYWITEER